MQVRAWHKDLASTRIKLLDKVQMKTTVLSIYVLSYNTCTHHSSQKKRPHSALPQTPTQSHFLQSGKKKHPLMPTNLALWNRSDPAQGEVDGNGDDADDPDGLLVIGALVPEDDGEDDAAEVARSPRAAGDDAVGVRVDVRHEAEDGAVGALEEEGEPGHEAEHGALLAAVGEADGELEDAREDRVGVDEVFFAPDARAGVDGVGEEAADGPAGDVEEAEHGRPPARARLAEGLEVLDVVGAQDGVDGQLGAKGAEVAAAGDEGLEGEDDRHGLLEARLLDNLPARDVEHLLFANLGFVREAALALARGVVFDLRVRVAVRRARFQRRRFLRVDLAGDFDDVAGDAVFGQVLLGGEVAFAPFPCGRVGADQQ